MNKTNIPETVEAIYRELSTYATKFPNWQKECEKNATEFRQQYENTIVKNRHLRLAIIGQVKAGKSSFLNTFLFEGEEVLPKAATPKTANLTIISHSEDERIEIEFFTLDDWETLCQSAKEYKAEQEKYEAMQKDNANAVRTTVSSSYSSGSPSTKAAFEMVQAAAKNGLDVNSYLGHKPKRLPFNNNSTMRDQLDEYVGESGEYTPITKAVWLYINDPRLIDLEIVDTPGLNDPVPARTEKTREMLKTTDVAFFLSQTGGAFFDETDVCLLVSQLPSEGVNYFELIGSKFDSVLQNFDADDVHSLEDAIHEVHSTYNKLAETSLNKHLVNIEFINPEIKEKLLNCLPPIYVSAFMHNWAIKAPEQWDEPEKHTYKIMEGLTQNWSDFTLDHDTLKRLGNMDSVVQIFNKVKQEKSEILEQKVKALAPSAEQKIQLLIAKIVEKSLGSISVLQNNGIADLEKQEKQLHAQIDNVKSGVSEVIGNIISECSKQMVAVKKELGERTLDLSTVVEKTGTKVKECSREVAHKESVLIFFEKTVYETQYYDRTTSYRYAAKNHAIGNLKKATIGATHDIEYMFHRLIEEQTLRLNLIDVIRKSLDAVDDSYNLAFFKRVIQEAIEQIDIPSVHIDSTKFIEKLANKFPKPQVTNSGVDKLNLALGAAMHDLYLYIISIVESEGDKFKTKLQSIRNELGKNLIDTALEDIDKLKTAMQNKDAEIKAYQACSDACEELSRKVHTALG